MGRPSEIAGHKENTEHKTKRGFRPLYDVLEENKLPVTVKMEKSQLLGRDNGLCTLQHRRVVTQLEYLQSSGTTTFIPVSKEENALAIMVDDEEIYETIEDLHVKKKGKKIQWFISTKEFYIDNVLCHVGHVFTFAPTSLLRSFRRGKNRGIYVLFYPTMEKHFVPMETIGNFYKCECPSTCRTFKLSELIQTKRFPCLLSFETNNGRMRDGINTADPYFAMNITEFDILYATKKSCGSLQLHTFSAHAHISVHVQPNRKPVDVLDVNELESIVKSVVLPLNSDLRYFYVIHSYKELGIIRLLQEIIDELSGRENNFSVISSARKLPNRITEPARKALSLPKVKSSSRGIRKTPNKVKVTSNYTNQPYGNHGQRTTHIYHNENVINNGTHECNGNVVDIDDSGYVIVPISCDISNLPKNDVEESTYKSSENMAYNYQFRTSNQFDDHIYTYINPIISDTLNDSPNINQTNKTSSIDDQHGVNNDYDDVHYRNVSSTNDEDGEERYYDYPYLGQVHMLKEQVKELKTEEVIDLLKLLNMKHHIDTFQGSSVDGNKLFSFCEKDLLNLNFTKFESLKILCFMEGWRPLKASLGDNAWLTQMVCNWSVNDVSKYLLRLQMRSFQKFCVSHDVDGYLLKKLIEGDVMECLKEKHDVTYRDNNFEKLKAYVIREEKPQFKFVTC